MGEKRYTCMYRLLVVKPEGMRLLGRHLQRWVKTFVGIELSPSQVVPKSEEITTI
jgi:hypothetical protein